LETIYSERTSHLASPLSAIRASSIFQKALLAVRDSSRATTSLPTTNKVLISSQSSPQRVQHPTISWGNLGNSSESSTTSNCILSPADGSSSALSACLPPSRGKNTILCFQLGQTDSRLLDTRHNLGLPASPQHLVISPVSLHSPSVGPIADPARGGGQAAHKRSSQDGSTITGFCGQPFLYSFQKRGRVQANPRLKICLDAPHFKMEGLFMLPTVVQREWVLGKINLKDDYLTIPVAQ